jgi:hypothetical protein
MRQYPNLFFSEMRGKLAALDKGLAIIQAQRRAVSLLLILTHSRSSSAATRRYKFIQSLSCT